MRKVYFAPSPDGGYRLMASAGTWKAIRDAMGESRSRAGLVALIDRALRDADGDMVYLRVDEDVGGRILRLAQDA